MATHVSEENYVNLLLEECYSRGLIGWLTHATTADVVAGMGTFTTWQTEDSTYYEELDRESTNDATIEQKQRARKLERKDLLEAYHTTHGAQVQQHTHHRYLQLGGTSEDWLAIRQKCPNNTLLYWLAALWKREETVKAMDNTASEAPPRAHARESFSDIPRSRQSDEISFTILGDIPQEPGYQGDDGVWDMIVKPVHIQFYIDRNTTFTYFQEYIVGFPFIRYHTTKNNPELATVLFVPDDHVYPPGLHAAWHEEGNTIRPERFPNRADVVYDDGPGRGWWSGIVDTSSQPDQAISRSIDWRSRDTEEDWEALLRTLRGGQGTNVAYLYHQSVRERIQFVQKQVDDEVEYMREHQGWKMFNFLLKRHRDEEKDGGIDSLCGARKDRRKEGEDVEMVDSCECKQ